MPNHDVRKRYLWSVELVASQFEILQASGTKISDPDNKHPEWSNGYDFRLSSERIKRGRPGFDSLFRRISFSPSQIFCSLCPNHPRKTFLDSRTYNYSQAIMRHELSTKALIIRTGTEYWVHLMKGDSSASARCHSSRGQTWATNFSKRVEISSELYVWKFSLEQLLVLTVRSTWMQISQSLDSFSYLDSELTSTGY
ncbi:hypothetical protein VTN31DRAFT_2961 [Thermomyces dupontii]|uniref:uncharacterized protein n=1 Tax=Talaromyces thermophilus TaxID=28565 RepID=UPI00374349CC